MLEPVSGDVRAELLERSVELGALSELIDAVQSGKGGLGVIDGAAGVGKSRLLDATEALAAAAGVRVLQAHGSELEREFASGVVLQLFEPVLAGLSVTARVDAFRGAARLAQSLFPAPGDEPPLEGGWGVHSMMHGLYWLASNLAASRPIVLLVDDAHWADEMSLRCLAYLARRLADSRIAVVITLRRDDEPASEPLIDLCAQPLVCRIRPAPLSVESVALLVRQRLALDADRDFCLGCARVTGGNPFLVHELLSELEADGVTPDAGAVASLDRLVPGSVLSAVVARIAYAGEGAGEVARAVAILGESASARRCAVLAALDVRIVERAADALVAAGVLAAGERLSFAHPLIGSAVAREIPARERGRAHLDAARILHDQRLPVEIVAGQLLAGSTGDGEQWAVNVLREAASRALTKGDPGAAAVLLARALAEPPQESQHGSVLAELGGAQAAAGDPAAAQTIERAIAAVGDPAQRALLERRRGDLLFAQGRAPEAIEAYDRGLKQVDPGGRDARELYAARAVVQSLAPGGVTEALAAVERIVERSEGDTPAERFLLAQMALRATLSGEPREMARALALRAWADGALLSDEGPDGHVWSLVTGALGWSDWSSDAESIATAVLEQAQRLGSLLAFATASYVRGVWRYQLGHIAEALDDLERALDVRSDGWNAWCGAASAALSRCLVERGELDRAAAVLEDPADRRWADTLEGLAVREAHAWLRLAAGQTERALEEYLALGERSEGLFAVRCPVMIPWHAGAALAAMRLGDPERARELAAAGIAVALAAGALRAVGRLQLIDGLAAGGDAGLRLMGNAVQALDDSDATLELTYALVELGAAQRRATAGSTPVRRSPARVSLLTVSAPRRSKRARPMSCERRAPVLAQDAADRRRCPHSQRAAHRRACEPWDDEPRNRRGTVRHDQGGRVSPRQRVPQARHHRPPATERRAATSPETTKVEGQTPVRTVIRLTDNR